MWEVTQRDAPPHATPQMKTSPSRPRLGSLGRNLRFTASALCLSLASAGLMRAEPPAFAPLPPPMTASQLVMTVMQSGVPQVATKGDPSVTKIRAITVNIHRVGNCDGHVTLKIAFVGQDVATNKKVVNSQTEKAAEAVPGKGSEYTETSAPFVYFPPSVDPKTKKPIPASGTKPLGWVVRVFQGDKLLSSQSSNPDLVEWIGKQSR